MFYGLSSLYSLLLYGKNFIVSADWPEGARNLMSNFWNFICGFFYWVSGHIFGTEQFYNSLSGHPEYLHDFNAWASSNGLLDFNVALPILLSFITTIIIVWGLVRLIVKVCSLGKITY